jgi:hypothetical protein
VLHVHLTHLDFYFITLNIKGETPWWSRHQQQRQQQQYLVSLLFYTPFCFVTPFQFTTILNLQPLVFGLTPFGWFIYIYFMFLMGILFRITPTFWGTQLWCKTRPVLKKHGSVFFSVLVFSKLLTHLNSGTCIQMKRQYFLYPDDAHTYSTKQILAKENVSHALWTYNGMGDKRHGSTYSIMSVLHGIPRPRKQLLYYIRIIWVCPVILMTICVSV